MKYGDAQYRAWRERYRPDIFPRNDQGIRAWEFCSVQGNVRLWDIGRTLTKRRLEQTLVKWQAQAAWLGWLIVYDPAHLEAARYQVQKNFPFLEILDFTTHPEHNPQPCGPA